MKKLVFLTFLVTLFALVKSPVSAGKFNSQKPSNNYKYRSVKPKNGSTRCLLTYPEQCFPRSYPIPLYR